jgi:DNA-binding response OmpR family regulator
MLTARDSVSDKVTGLDAGADDYLAKPFTPRDLLDRVTRLLEPAHSA